MNHDVEIVAPCGCYAHDPGADMEGDLAGHPFCDYPDPLMVAREKRGEIDRAYVNGEWRWFPIARRALGAMPREAEPRSGVSSG